MGERPHEVRWVPPPVVTRLRPRWMTFLSSLLGRIAAALPAERRVLARRGWEGEKVGHSEQPAIDFKREKQAGIRESSDQAYIWWCTFI